MSTTSDTPLDRVARFLDLIRFSHTLFALPFALLAAVMAWLQPPQADSPATPFSWWHLAGIIVCMTAARSAAMAFNRIADRDIDGDNPRTAERHLPAGTLSLGEVIFFAVASSIAFFAGTAIFWPNPLPLILGLPVLLFLLGYSYTKRFTSLAHFWLGTALMLAPISAWIAIRGEVLLSHPLDLLPAIALGAAVLLWVAGFDILYACQDADFDREKGLFSVPATLGGAGALRVAALCHVAMLGMLVVLPWVYPALGVVYWMGVGAIAILLAVEHWLVRPDDLSQVNLAFFYVNAVVSVGLLVATTIDLLW